ncbi:MAG TPA: VOC family protein [Parvularculaceae bacterium]|nr:VOC family protein [Parvularculaceae bacterium]
MIENTIPILCVADLKKSVEFYHCVLGFDEDFNTGDFAGVSRDRCGLYLAQNMQGPKGAWVWIGVEDAEAVRNAALAAGAKPGTLKNYSWALEFRLEDPDGHVLRIGSESRNDRQLDD